MRVGIFSKSHPYAEPKQKNTATAEQLNISHVCPKSQKPLTLEDRSEKQLLTEREE